MAKNKSYAKLKKELDAVFSKYIRKKTEKEYGNCPFCRIRPIEHCFHFLSRKASATRWREDNVIGSCASCNMQMNYEPTKFILWFIDKRGKDKLEFLEGLYHTAVKFSAYDLQMMIDEYKKKLDTIE